MVALNDHRVVGLGDTLPFQMALGMARQIARAIGLTGIPAAIKRSLTSATL
jgi:hypothetical protein